jgi:hypothetical protein
VAAERLAGDPELGTAAGCDPSLTRGEAAALASIGHGDTSRDVSRKVMLC